MLVPLVNGTPKKEAKVPPSKESTGLGIGSQP